MDKRKRGRAGMEQRARRRALYPFCAECAKLGIIRATKIIDHKEPLAFGGPDTDENCQGLCLACDAIKTAGESSSAGGARNHPEWLKPSAIPVSIVCGPPCSGKSTLVAKTAARDDLVIDLDAIMARLQPGWEPWISGVDQDLFNRAIRARNAMLGQLHMRRVEQCARAWFIIGAPTNAERAWWRGKLGPLANLLQLDLPLSVCVDRALVRGTPSARPAIERWFRERRSPWSPMRSKPTTVACGDDGYPVEC